MKHRVKSVHGRLGTHSFGAMLNCIATLSLGGMLLGLFGCASPTPEATKISSRTGSAYVLLHRRIDDRLAKTDTSAVFQYFPADSRESLQRILAVSGSYPRAQANDSCRKRSLGNLELRQIASGKTLEAAPVEQVSLHWRGRSRQLTPSFLPDIPDFSAGLIYGAELDNTAELGRDSQLYLELKLDHSSPATHYSQVRFLNIRDVILKAVFAEPTAISPALGEVSNQPSQQQSPAPLPPLHYTLRFRSNNEIDLLSVDWFLKNGEIYRCPAKELASGRARLLFPQHSSEAIRADLNFYRSQSTHLAQKESDGPNTQFLFQEVHSINLNVIDNGRDITGSPPLSLETKSENK